MRFALLLLVTVALGGCSGDSVLPSPTAPDPPRPTLLPPPTRATELTLLWGMVVNRGGGCIPGASVEVISGQALGQRIEQITPCSVWDVEGGFYFRNLAPDVAMTLRATAPGYAPEEKTFVPLPGPGYRAVFLEPSELK